MITGKQEYFRLSEICLRVGVMRHTLTRAIACGSMPKPDLIINRMQLWHVDTIDEWLTSSRPKTASKRKAKHVG
jgi:predicted DNA-binding transcriptional regulator AlpA